MKSVEEGSSFYHKLQKEIELWLRENIITPEQKDKILSRYHILKQADEKAGPGKLITTISVLGSVLVGIGVILFIASNWSEIPRWGKLAIIFSSMMISYGTGFYVRIEKKNYPKIGAALILLGSFIFGAGIFLIAQIYHITVHYPNGPLMWGLGVLPLAYLLRLKSLLSLSIITLLIWLGMESSSRTVLVNMEIPYITLYLMAGIMLWGSGLMHKGYKSLAMIASPYAVAGMMLTFLCGFLLTFDEFFKMALGSGNLLTFYSGIGLLFLMTIILYIASKSRDRGWLAEIISLSFLMVAAIYLSLVYKGDHPDVHGIVTTRNITLSSNLIYALGIIGIVFLGYMRHNRIYINIGLLFFVLDVCARYFDYFWKLLPRSMFFIIGGTLLLIGGIFLEKKRRKILASFNFEGDER
jgi:uncharacterized membrane protein